MTFVPQDVAAAKQWGVGMGKEFYDKGANVQLGYSRMLQLTYHSGPSCTMVPHEELLVADLDYASLVYLGTAGETLETDCIW